MSCLGHGVVAAAAPGVTGEDALGGEVEGFVEGVLLEGFEGVLGAGGLVATGGGEVRREEVLVGAYEEDEEVFHALVSILVMSLWMMFWILVWAW